MQLINSQGNFALKKAPKERSGMRKTIFIMLVLVFACALRAYSQESTLMTMRNKIFEESKSIKTLLVDSKDFVLLNTLWDSCIVSITQLDAYFYMIGMYNTIKKEKLAKPALDYLIRWLGELKKTNDLNLRSLKTLTKKLDAKTKAHIDTIKTYFSDLNVEVIGELNKLSELKKL
jgi:hypothetical protein